MGEVMTKLKMFQFDTDDLENNKCGGCNWEVSKLYLMAESREAALKELKEIQKQDGNALCGDCMSEMLAEGNYIIDNQETLDKCPKCGKPIGPVASARDYVIYGCLEHREFDSVKNI